VIMALGNASNPIVKDAEPGLKTSKWGTIEIKAGSQETSIDDVYTGGDANRGGSTAIKAAGDGQAAAREIAGMIPFSDDEVRSLVASAQRYTEHGQADMKILQKIELAEGIVEFVVYAPLIARSARAGQFVRVLAWDKGELIPLTLADWDADQGTIDLVVQGLGSSSMKIDQRIGLLQAEYPELLDVVYTTNDGSFGYNGFVTGPLEEMLTGMKDGGGRAIGEVVTIGPPLMMRAVSDLTKPYGVKTVASLNSIMVDATGMCGACMVPVTIDGKMVRKHACIDGPELDSHIIDWDKFLPRFLQFSKQEAENRAKHGFG